MNRIFEGMGFGGGIAEVRGQIAELNGDKVSKFQGFKVSSRIFNGGL